MKSSRLARTLAACLVLPTSLLAQDDQGAGGGQQPPIQLGPFQPAEALRDQPLTTITDLDTHLGRRLSYVRSKADYVPCDLGEVDIQAEVLAEVDGKPVTRDEFRRRAIMYTGQNEIDKAITAAICKAELARIVAAGGDPDDYLVGDAEIDRRIEDMKEMIRLRAGQTPGQPSGPDGQNPADWAVEQFLQAIDVSIGMQAYRERHQSEASFEKIFLPMPAEATHDPLWDLAQGPLPVDDPKPDWMPQATWDALAATESDRLLRNHIKECASKGTEIASLFRGQLTSKIRVGVIEDVGLDYFFDADLPEGVFLRVGDTDVATDELYPLIEGMLVDTDIQLILRELLTLRAMKEDLQARGAWMSDAEFREAFHAEEAIYKGTLLPLSSIVIFRGYYSVDRFREHYRYGESFRRWKRTQMTDEDIERHYTEGGRMLFERGMVEVELAYNRIDIEAPYDEANFLQAEAAMQAVLDASRFRVDTVDGETHHFATAEERDGFLASLPDQERTSASTSEHPQGDFDAVKAKFRSPDRAEPGELGNWYFQRNPLRQFLTESELSILLTGYSLTDDLFYNTHPGDVVPMHAMRCRRHYWGGDLSAGVWMARVKSFARGRQLPALQGEKLEQARTDYLDLTFLYWSQECLKQLLDADADA